MELGKIQFLKNIPARVSLSVVEETDFPAGGNHFFLHFSEAPVSFFPSGKKKYFSTKSFIATCGNGFSGYWKPFSFVQRFSFKWEPSLKLVDANF